MYNKLIAILLLFLLLPILCIVSIFILLADGFPIMFVQKRYGRKNKYFDIYKFRTMKKNTPNIATDKMKENPYYKGGLILRKLSLDEIPQLFNIIKGDMNFIGPRPALYNQIDLAKARHEIGIDNLKPGITGWAQINGRDLISEKEKVDLDYFYLKNKSFKLNCKILVKTIYKVLSVKDISE